MEHVATQENEREDIISEATQQDCECLDATTAVLRYSGTLPPPIGSDVALPLPQTSDHDEEFLILCLREKTNQSQHKKDILPVSCYKMTLVERISRHLEITPQTRIRRDLEGRITHTN